MLPYHADTFLPGRGWRDFAGLQEFFGPLKNPRIADRAAPYHHAIHAGLFKHPKNGGRGQRISVADQRDIAQPVFPDITEVGPAGNPCIHLFARAGVYGQRLDATVFQHPGHINNINAVVIPPQPGLDGYRTGGHGNHRPGDSLHFGQVSQNSGTRFLADHLADRTAEVDINNIRLRAIHDCRSLFDLLHITPKNLNPHRPFVGAYIQFHD